MRTRPGFGWRQWRLCEEIKRETESFVIDFLLLTIISNYKPIICPQVHMCSIHFKVIICSRATLLTLRGYYLASVINGVVSADAE